MIAMTPLPERQISFEKQYDDAITDEDFLFEEEALSIVFKQLPLLRQKILKYAFVYHLSAREIADKLNCSVNYVYLQKHRALKYLRDVLLFGGLNHEDDLF